MAENTLAALARAAVGKGAARKLRAAGRIPAVVYGAKTKARALSVDPHALDKTLRASGAGLNTLISLRVQSEGADENSADAAQHRVLLKALQRDPVRGAFMHADFYEVDLTKRVTVSVPVQTQGRAPGVELEGGILDHPVRELELSCLPEAIPKNIAADVSALGLGQSLHVGDLQLPEGVELRTGAELAVATVVAPRTAQEETAEGEAAEGAEAADGEAAGDSATGDSADAAKKEKGGGEKSG